MSARVFLVVGFVAVTTAAQAQVGEFGPRQEKVKGVVLRCAVVCVQCELQKAHGVGGHDRNAQHVIGVKTPERLIFTLLPCEAAKLLLIDPKWLGKHLDLNGRTFPKTMVLEVFHFKEVDPKNPQVRQLMYFCYV